MEPELCNPTAVTVSNSRRRDTIGRIGRPLEPTEREVGDKWKIIGRHLGDNWETRWEGGRPSGRHGGRQGGRQGGHSGRQGLKVPGTLHIHGQGGRVGIPPPASRD